MTNGRRPPAAANGTQAGVPAEVGGYTPESYLATVTELIRAGHDAEAVAVVQRHGQAMLPRLSPEQVVLLTSMMEGADAALEARAFVNRRHARRATAHRI